MKTLEWEEAFALLEEYKKEYGTLPKTEEIYRGFKLGRWYKNQCVILKNEKSDPERVQRLLDLGIAKNKFDLNWEHNFKLLQNFIQEYNRFPKSAEIYEGVCVGKWCDNQKKQAVNPDYPKERMEKLKEIGLLDTTRSALWDKHYQLLEAFLQEHNRFPKNREIYCDFNLGYWCAEQKQKALKPDYNPYRLKKLQEIGLLDNIQKPLPWEEIYQLLKEYVAEYHKFPVAKEVYKGYGLGTWCERQKFLSKNPDYPEERLQKLREIGIFSTTQDAKWERNYQLVLEFIEEYGRLPKQKESYRGERIGHWCTMQKMRYNSEEKMEKLKQIGLLDNTQITKWEEHYQQLKEFVDEFHRFPKRDEIYCDFNIGSWCAEQKQKASKGKYDPDRMEKLREIGLLENNLKLLTWEENYQLLQEYVAEYNRFPTEKELYKGYNIGSWYQSQKALSENPDYPIEQLQKLEEVVVFCSPRDAKWERNYQLLQEFITEHHRFPKASETYHDFAIGNWCAEQKKGARKETYPPYRIEKLVAIGFLNNDSKPLHGE